MQEGYGTCLVCVCVCVGGGGGGGVCVSSVTAPVPTALVSMLKMRYIGGYLRLFSLLNSL